MYLPILHYYYIHTQYIILYIYTTVGILQNHVSPNITNIRGLFWDIVCRVEKVNV